MSFVGVMLVSSSGTAGLSTVVTSLGRFHVFVSSVFRFVDFGAYLV